MFLISDAHAQAAAPAAADPSSGMLIMLPLMIVIMYFMVFRPQSKRAKEHKALLDALAKGDEVITQGGVAGTVVEVRDNFVKVSIANDVEVLVQKVAITAVLPKGSLKAA